MSLQWTLIASFLYFEIFLVFLLLLPFISACRWQSIFKSKLLKAVSNYAKLYFNIFVVVLVILFLDSIRDVRRYSAPVEDIDLRNNPQNEAVIHMKLFRAQRNFYIAGFALFLFLVLGRLVSLLSRTANLEAQAEAAIKQAESASATAKQLLEEKENTKNEKDEASDIDRVKAEKDLVAAKYELEDVQAVLRKSQTNYEALKKQAESTNMEYDRLLEEHTKLQEQLKQMEGTGDTKKDD